MRDRIQPYATGLYYRESENLREERVREALGYVDAGFRAMKLKIGLDFREDVAQVEAIRAAIGPDVQLMIDANHAYWVNTTAFTPISTLIPERDPAAVLPTVSVVAGWNLIPIIDLQQTAAPTQANLATRNGALAALVPVTANPGFNAATYFASITWSVAYGFDTQANQWRKITAIAGDFVGQGKGYWVWATRDGTLVP